MQNTTAPEPDLGLLGHHPQTATSRFAAPSISFSQFHLLPRPASDTFTTIKVVLPGIQRFSFSMNPSDVSIIYNDIGIGYFLVQHPGSLRVADGPCPDVRNCT